MIQKVNQKFIFSFLLTDVIKENGDLLCKVQKKTKKLNSKIFKTENSRLIMHSKCPKWGIKKSRLVKAEEAKGLLSNFGIKTLLSKIPLLDVLFQVYKNE